MKRQYLCSQNGFIVAELLVILFVIFLLGALLVPVFIDSGMSAGETAAAASIKTIVQALNNYKAATGNFPRDLAALANNKPPYLDVSFSSGIKDGYVFSYKITGPSNFIVIARPQLNRGNGIKSFFSDSSGAVRWTRIEAPLATAELAESR